MVRFSQIKNANDVPRQLETVQENHQTQEPEVVVEVQERPTSSGSTADNAMQSKNIDEDEQIHLEASMASFTKNEMYYQDIGSTSRTGATPFGRQLYRSSCFAFPEHSGWTCFKSVWVKVITFSVYLCSFAIMCAVNITSCVLNCLCAMLRDDKRRDEESDVCCYISIYDVMYRSMQISEFIFSLIFIHAGPTGKIIFTLIYIVVLILGGRCIYEDYKYGNTFKTYPGLFFINTDELFDGESINKLILVTMEEIHVELLQYKISMSSHQEQFESLQSHTSDAGAMVIILFNRDWKRMYHDYNYSLWLWVEFIFLFAVIIVAWAMHE